MKSVSVYENKTLLANYYNACVDYFKKVNDATYRAVVEAEHACREGKISFGHSPVATSLQQNQKRHKDYNGM